MEPEEEVVETVYFAAYKNPQELSPIDLDYFPTFKARHALFIPSCLSPRNWSSLAIFSILFL